MDKGKLLDRLNQLREQAYQLVSKPMLGKEFEFWYKETMEVIQNLFGADSEEMKEFRQINFEIDHNVIQSQKHKIKVLAHQFNVKLQDDFEIPQDHYYYERLHDAAELMLVMIVGLKARDKA